MDFQKSTQARKWLFTIDALNEARKATYDNGKIKYGTVLSYEEYWQYIQFYADELIRYSHAITSWSRFQRYTALALYQRIYIRKSIWDIPPPLAMLNCLFIVCKFVYPVTSEDLINTIKLDQSIIDRFMPFEQLARTEIIMLDGIDFNLKIHLPFHHLYGLINNQLSKADQSKAGDKLMEILQTDALLLYTPSQIAYAALAIEFGPEVAHNQIASFNSDIDVSELDKITEEIAALKKVDYNLETVKKLEEGMAPEFTAAEVLASTPSTAEADKSLVPPSC